jgi:ABC-type polysaccharide/polyol phosphate export permease
MKLFKAYEIVTSEQAKKLVLYDFAQKIAGNQTFFHRFWPIFQVVSPILLGYVVFGNLLEQPTGEVPFRIWVSTGAIVWLLVLCVVNSGSKIFSNKTRRARFLLYGPTFWTQLGSTFIQYFIVIAILNCYVFFYVFKEKGIILGLSKLLLTLFLLLISIPIMQMLVIIIGIGSAFFKDFRMLTPFVTQALLFLSPIFFQLPPANSLPEKLLAWVNPLNPLLDSFRSIILSDTDMLNHKIYSILFISILCFFLNTYFLRGFTLTILGNLNNRTEDLSEDND